MKENETADVLTVRAPEGDYEIRLSRSLTAEMLEPFAKGKSCFAVTDSNVSGLYLGKLYGLLKEAGAGRIATFEFPAGEDSKNFRTVERICRVAVQKNLDRTSVIFALGGGVPGDLAGFAAAIFMRGIPFVQIPTTLLAMVDSSVGGKTGCDLPEGKNLIGAFHQPLGVLTDVSLLHTLPDGEYLCGIAEIIKTAAILDSAFFAELEKNVSLIRGRDDAFTLEMIRRTCALKAKIVGMDEKEAGIRAILNYGHTFGHALEKASGYTLKHGFAVAGGMRMVAGMAEKLGLCSPESASRQNALLDAAGFPSASADFDRKTVFEALFRDKKTVNGELRFVIVPEIGRAEIRKIDAVRAGEYLGLK